MRMNKFTIVIPTRERANTLISTLKTCVNQNYENLRIIVSDNFSQDDTKDIVFSFGDKRIHYINTGSRVDMSSNWNLALQCALEEEGYITYIGDDDGMLLGSVAELNDFFNSTPCEALSWKKVEYCWPDHIVEGYKNYLNIPLKSDACKVDSIIELNKCINFEQSYNKLPCLYNSFVSSKVLKKINSQLGGLFFRSSIPDVFSAVIIANFIPDYIYSEKPFSINGASSHSNGTSYMQLGQEGDAARKFISEVSLEFDKCLVMCPSVEVAFADSVINVKKILGGDFKANDINIKELLRVTLRSAELRSQEVYEQVRTAIYRMGKLNDQDDFVGDLLSKSKHNFTPVNIKYGFNLSEGVINLDASYAGVKDVYDASIFVSHLLSNSGLTYTADLPSVSPITWLLKKFGRI